MVEEQRMKDNENNMEQNTPTIHQKNENCQVFNGPISGCVFAMPGSTVNQSPVQQVTEKSTLTVSDKEIKSAVESLMKELEDNGEFLFRNKKQWYAVYRVLETYCNYPSKMTLFVSKMKELELDHIDAKRTLTYESLVAAPKEVPLMACTPSNWSTLKDKSEHYMQQYVVAEFLMLKLGVKS